MSDPIERQAAIDAMTNTLWHYPSECYRNLNEYEFAKGLSELGLKSVPSAQPEIVRCKECKHRGEKPIADGRYWCEIHDTFMYYCSDAERRTDERSD